MSKPKYSILLALGLMWSGACAALAPKAPPENTTELIANHHSDMRLSTEGGNQEGRGAFLATQFRYALHDFLDRKGDYPHSTSIEIASVKWRVHIENTRPWLDELTLLRVLRIPTLAENDGEMSWGFDAGMRTARETFCVNCLAGHVRGALGVTEAPIRGVPLEVFLLGEAEISIAPNAIDSAFQPALGPWLGLRLWWSDNWTAFLSGRYRYYFLTRTKPGSFQTSAAIRYYLGWDMAVEGRVARLPDGWEYAGGLFVYF